MTEKPDPYSPDEERELRGIHCDRGDGACYGCSVPSWPMKYPCSTDRLFATLDRERERVKRLTTQFELLRDWGGGGNLEDAELWRTFYVELKRSIRDVLAQEANKVGCCIHNNHCPEGGQP